MVTFPVIAAALIRLAFGGPEPVSPEARAAQEEVLRYRIRRLDVGDKNGWTFLTDAVAAQPKASAASREALKAALDGNRWNAADLKLLADQAPAFRAIVVQALEKPYWQSPWDPAPGSKEASLASAAIAAPVAATRAIVAFLLMESANGRTTGLMADLKLLLKLADTSMQGSISFEEWLAGTANHHILNRLVIRCLSDNKLTAETLRQLSTCLENSPMSVGGVRESLRHSAATDLAFVTRLNNKSLSGRDSDSSKPGAGTARGMVSQFLVWLTFSTDETAALHSRLAAGIISRCDEPCDASGLPAYKEILDAAPPRSTWDYLQFNAYGKHLVLSSLRTYEPALKALPIKLTSRAATLAAVGLKRWEMDHGNQLPASLAALVPDYLPSIPIDLADGKPLRYSPEEKLLYSIGLNGEGKVPPTPELNGFSQEKNTMVLRLP